MKLFVDDMRSAPEGWQLARTVTEAIRMLSGPMYFEAVSLDHDIIFETTNRKVGFSGETFATVAYYIALLPQDKLPKKVYLHTANHIGARDMENILKDIVPTEIIDGSYDLTRNDYKEQLVKLEQEREEEEKKQTGEFKGEF